MGWLQVFLTPRHLAIAMEYAQGGDLFNVSRGPLILDAMEPWSYYSHVVIGTSSHSLSICLGYVESPSIDAEH